MSVLMLLDTYLYLLTSRRCNWRSPNFRFLYCYSNQVHVFPRLFLSSQQHKPLCNKAGERTVITKHLSGDFSRISKLSTTTSKGLTIAKKSMSRIKNTFDSVSKAVSSTHNELISRIVRPKPNPASGGKEENAQVDQSDAPQPDLPCPKAQENVQEKLIASDPKNTAQSKPCLEQDVSQDPTKESTDPKTNLFHANYFASSFGETYNFVANHINWYYFGETSMEKNKITQEPSVASNKEGITSGVAVEECAPPSPKRSISNFLSNQSNNVHAFVGSYLGGLVPKLRSEPKSSILDENGKELECNASENKAEQDAAKENKGADERAKRLSLQREKIIARVSVDNRTRALVQSLHRATDRRLCISRVEELSCHLLEFPETRGVAVKERVIPSLLRLRQAHDETLQAVVREALALVGYNDPVKGRGIRVLTIDGGGTRGIVALQTLHKLEELTGKPIHHLFDYICGVSTGAILGFMLGLFRIPLDECEELYRNLGKDVFKQNVILGTVKMGWNHAYYDSEIWEKMLKERMGSDLLIETARNPLCPKVSAVSTIVNRGLPLKAYVFRNYNHFPGVKSHYMGGCQYNLWQAIRASSAAPGYFQEYVLGNDLHQDGGLLINNPSALALHECKCLWPNVPLQCVVSLGTGRYETAGKSNATHTSLKAKITNVISSATDTEEVHKTLDALLPPDTYFRFNPVMTEDIMLDENRKEKLSQLQMDGMLYLQRNEEKLKKAAKVLALEKTTVQQICDWVKLKRDMYDGLPPFSKL
ncbi:calcium-independent phospholipase A2-gamma [Spea bombifrons]|uniref:calcium-independent phospholipase A2-gamma n=1 Tax=Spea bombifrons TaxID=233779 RepID=UPI00234B874E|nr:calcium-independent phospholipase A2-gamma [Spea bombifrons]XP_053318918.1 calcium-independent phospholipase A2-gamma [Spea bombifrons]